MKSIPKFNPKDFLDIYKYWKAYIEKHKDSASNLWLYNLNQLKQNEFNARHMESLTRLIYHHKLKDVYEPGVNLAMVYEHSPKHQEAINLITPKLRFELSPEEELNFLCWDRNLDKIETFYPKSAYGYLLNVMECALTIEENDDYYPNLVFLLPVVASYTLTSLADEKTIPKLEDTYARIIAGIFDNLDPVLEKLDNQTCFKLLFVLNAIVTDINERHPDKAPISELRQDEYKTGAKQIQTLWTTRYPEAAHEYNKLNSLGVESYSIWLSFQAKPETELLPTLDF